MSGNGYTVGAGIGGVIGGVAGGIYGGPPAAVGGAGAGAAVGGFIGNAISPDTSVEDAEREAQEKLDRARNEYESGMRARNAQDMEAYNKIATQQLQGQSDRVDKAQTGKQSAAMLNQKYTDALKQGNAAADETAAAPVKALSGRAASAAPEVQAKAHGILGVQNAALAQNRGQAAMLADAHNASVTEIQDLAAEAAQKYSLDEIKLNRQIAYVANVSGIERAVLAARYAAATGQYPLDMANAAHAGDRAAFQHGMISAASNVATSVAGSGALDDGGGNVGTGEPGSTLGGGSGDVGGGDGFDAGAAPSGYDDTMNLRG